MRAEKTSEITWAQSRLDRRDLDPAGVIPPSNLNRDTDAKSGAIQWLHFSLRTDMTLTAFLTLEIPSKFIVVLVSKGLNQNKPREKCTQEFTVAVRAFRVHLKILKMCGCLGG